jgi:hypothetical protein
MDIDTQAAIRRLMLAKPAEATEILADTLNRAANVLGAYAMRFGEGPEFIPEMATVIEQSARNYVVLNK